VPNIGSGKSITTTTTNSHTDRSLWFVFTTVLFGFQRCTRETTTFESNVGKEYPHVDPHMKTSATAMCILPLTQQKRDSNIDDDNDDDDESSIDQTTTTHLMIPLSSLPDANYHPPWTCGLSTEHASLLLLLISAGCYSVMGCFVKLVTTTTNISPIQVVFVRAVVQMIVVVMAMFFVTIPVVVSPSSSHHRPQLQQQPEKEVLIIKHPLGLSKDIARLCIIRGMCGGCGFCLYFYTISVLPLGDAMTILSLNPVITVLIAPILLNEPLTKTQLFSAISSVIGSIVLARPPRLWFGGGGEDHIGFMNDNQNDNKDLADAVNTKWGYLTGLLGACTAAGTYILIRKAGKKGVHTLNLLFSWCVFGLLFSTVIMILNKNGFVWPSSSVTWMYLTGSCVFGMTAHFILNFAARLAPAGIASIIRSSGIVWSYVLEVSVFHQVPQAWTIMGVGLILTSLGVIALEKHQESRQQSPSQPHMRLATSEEEAELHDSSNLQMQHLGSSLSEVTSIGQDDNRHHHRRDASSSSYRSSDDNDADAISSRYHVR
jgi:drug/metabolite transporter (DMT)-like permease